MVVAFNPLVGTGYNGALDRIGTRIGSSLLSSLGRPLTTNPGQVTLPAAVVIPSLSGTRAAGVIRSLMFWSLAPS